MKVLAALKLLLDSAPAAAPAPAHEPGLFASAAQAALCAEWLEDEWERVGGNLKWCVGEPH